MAVPQKAVRHVQFFSLKYISRARERDVHALEILYINGGCKDIWHLRRLHGQSERWSVCPAMAPSFLDTVQSRHSEIEDRRFEPRRREGTRTFRHIPFSLVPTLSRSLQALLPIPSPSTPFPAFFLPSSSPLRRVLLLPLPT